MSFWCWGRHTVGMGQVLSPGTLGPNGVWMEMFMEQVGQDGDNTQKEFLTSSKICSVSQKLR